LMLVAPVAGVGAFGMLAYGFRALLGKEKGFYGEVAG